MKSPSQKQIKFANEIASTLNLDSPKESLDFTAQAYWIFISEHIEEYKSICKAIRDEQSLDDSDDPYWGYDYGLWEY